MRGKGLIQWVSSWHQAAKVLELQLQQQFFQWIFRMISFRIDWFDLLAVQETLKNLLQHHNSKASIFWCSAFLCPKSYICTWLLNKPWLWLYGPLLAKWCLCFLICWLGRTDAKAETPILWPPHVKSWLIGKDPDAGRDWGQEEKGTTEDEMAGWHHQLNGHEFE